MSSLARSWSRNIIRKRVEKESNIQKTKLRKKRKDRNKKLGVERNITLFRRAWFDYHYGNGKTKKTKKKRLLKRLFK